MREIFVTTKIPIELRDKLAAHAFSMDRSMSAEIRRMLSIKFTDEPQADPQKAEAENDRSPTDR